MARPTHAARGFTLIELLIVIALLLFLMSLTAVSLMGLFGKAKASNSAQALGVTGTLLQEFIERFPVRTLPGDIKERGYPIKANWPDTAGIVVSQMTDGEWLRLLLYPSQKELDTYLTPFGVTSRVASPEVIERFLNDREITVNPGNLIVPAKHAIVDGWQRPIYYRFPGVSHVLERNAQGEAGSNHFLLGLPDMWSAGEDGVSTFGNYGGAQPSSADLTSWADPIVNDPLNSGLNGVIDDVPNWFGRTNY